LPTPNFLNLEIVLKIHTRQIEKLRIHDYNLTLSNQSAYNLVIGVANHQISKEELIDYLKVNIINIKE
jgi:hypothetical protein